MLRQIYTNEKSLSHFMLSTALGIGIVQDIYSYMYMNKNLI
jgi:hypothetical protein